MSHSNGFCGKNRGVPIAEIGYATREVSILTIARHYCSTFANPAGHTWITAVSLALQEFGDRRGPDVSVAVLAAVQALRRSRCSTFRFNNPGCAGCSRYVTPHERAFMASLRAVARGRMEDAAGHAGLLCEGNDVRAFLEALDGLAVRAFSDGQIPRRAADRQNQTRANAARA